MPGEEGTDAFENLKRSLEEMKNASTALSGTIASKLGPTIEELEKLQEKMTELPDAVNELFGGIELVLEQIFEQIKKIEEIPCPVPEQIKKMYELSSAIEPILEKIKKMSEWFKGFRQARENEQNKD